MGQKERKRSKRKEHGVRKRWKGNGRGTKRKKPHVIPPSQFH